MEEQEQNNIPSDTSNNDINCNSLNQINESEQMFDIEEPNINQGLIKSLENKVKELKRKIQAYEKNAEEQNMKLSDYDHLIVELDSLTNKNSQLEQDLETLKNENNQLKDIINAKNKTIIEFKELVETSKSKFDLFNQTNNSLKMKIADLESKLKSYPNVLKNNNNLEQKISEYESKMEQIRDEFNKKEELYKVKMNNQEVLNRNELRSKDEEINELKNETLKLKNQLDLVCKKNDDLLNNKKLFDISRLSHG